jgi:hypothetical protein
MHVCKLQPHHPPRTNKPDKLFNMSHESKLDYSSSHKFRYFKRLLRFSFAISFPEVHDLS